MQEEHGSPGASRSARVSAPGVAAAPCARCRQVTERGAGFSFIREKLDAEQVPGLRGQAPFPHQLCWALSVFVFSSFLLHLPTLSF